MLVVGAREAEDGTISVRRRAGEDLGAMPTSDFLARVRELSTARSREL
jgi:threonyl-tRNA synthetase